MSNLGGVSPQAHVVVAPHVRCRRFDTDLVMVDLEGGEYFALDQVGARMWELLVVGESPARIAVILTAEYEANERDVLGDCIDLTEQLLKRGLLVLQQPQPGS